MTEYAIRVRLETDFAAAVERTRAALAAEGFGVLTEIDVAATMLAKLGEKMDAYLILGACNPPLAHRALMSEAAIGLLLPCNVVVREADGAVLVEAMDPEVMVRATGNADLEPVALQARARLCAALDSLAA